MTHPGGSRDDDDRAAREVASPGSAPDNAADDAPAGDPQLRAMRSIWLEMRDEDPPDRGLTDLLAAARHKAEAMQPRPGAWQRLLAALRRPPVLALATVTVLIAGAVLIGRRVPSGASPGPNAAQDTARPAGPAARELGAGSSSGELGAGPEAAGAYRIGQAVDRGGAPAAAPQPAAPPPPPIPPPPDRNRSRPVQPAHLATPAIPAPGEAARRAGDRAAAAPSPAKPADTIPAPSPSERATELGAAAAVSSADTATGNHARTEPRVANSGAAPARLPAPSPSRPDAPGDLYRQCEAAARRGDCAAVRRLVSRITRTDRGYPARLAKDSPVGKCLVE